MTKTTLTWITAALVLVAAGLTHLRAADAPAATPAKKPLVQIAILLDTSNSMDGLIDQAKTQLWTIVNEFARASRDGQRPEIEVALYHYGTPSLGEKTGYIKQLTPLTNDLDKVSEQLFKLKTDGGDEYCGWVVKNATEELKWSPDKDAYKAIFVCGNEPFTQGPVDYKTSVKAAITKGIIVNTIFCGDDLEGINTNWKDGATLGEGNYMSINQNKKVVAIAAPQDKEISELNTKLNTTYVRYGKAGDEGAQRQAAQETNAASAGSAVLVERAAAKSSGSYQNAGWDLVDAAKNKQVKLDEIKKEDLPAEMKDLDPKAREAYIAQKAQERADIAKKIQELAAERAKFIAAQQKATGEKTLDAAVLEAVHTQAQRVQLQFEKK